MGPRLAIAASFAIIGFPASLGAQTDASGPVRQAIIESLQDSQWVRLSAAEGGGLIGALVGTAAPRWKRRYP